MPLRRLLFSLVREVESIVNHSNAVVWSVEMGATPGGPMMVAGDVVLAPTQSAERQHSTLGAAGLADGSPRWQQSFEYALVSGLETLRVSQTLRVLLTLSSTDVMRGEGALLALDAAGAEVWRWSPGVQRVSAPAVVDDLVCVTADARMFVALDAATGAERVRVELDVTASLAAPALQTSEVWETSEVSVAYIPCRGPHLVALGLDGKLRWRFDVPDAPDAWLDRTPVAVGDRVFAVLSTGAVLAMRAQDGTLAWQSSVGPGKRLSAPVADGERLYVGARDGVHALNLRDGEPAWVFPTGREVEAAPVVSGGVMYAVCHDHRVYALDALSGKALWQHEMERRIEVPPVLAAAGAPARSCVLVADRGGALVAVERPLSAAEHEAAGDWVEAASGYVESGQISRGAEVLTAHGYALEAAPLWKQAGELECAAEQYQVAGAWQEAAELWAALDRPHRQAEALEQHARALDPAAHGDEERAVAWESAAQVFRAEGEAERALACQREAALFRRRPLIQVQVEAPPVMTSERYYEIGFTLTNVGGGTARQVILRHTHSEFAGDLQASRELRNVSPGQSVQEVLSLRPLASGQVPLEVSVTFADSAGRVYEVRHRTLLSVGTFATTGREWNTAAIRELLTAAFDDEEIRTLCFDHFPPVYEDFASGMGKRDMIHRLVEYCVRHERMQELLTLVERKNPIQYERFRSELKS